MKGTSRKLGARALLLLLLAQLHFVPCHASEDQWSARVEQARHDPAGWIVQTLNQKWRPHLTEIVRVLQACEVCREALLHLAPHSVLDSEYRDYTNLIQEVGPKIVALLEGLYPNGVFALLGRDTLMIGDLLESFYLTQDVPVSPVVRLHASVATVTELTDRERGLEFLISNGLDLERAASGQRPYVLIDRTYYSRRSQSVKLMRAVLLSTTDLEYRAKLARFVNVHATNLGRPVGFDRGELAGIAAARRAPQIELEADVQIPFLVRAPNGADALIGLEQIAWHAPFSGEIVRLEDGRLAGTPGNQASAIDRLLTLRYMWDIFQIVRAPQFLDAASGWANRLGIDLQKQIEGRRSSGCARNLVANGGAA